MKNDVTYIAIILGLFVLASALVAVCDRIIGSDEAALSAEGSDSPVSAGRNGDDIEPSVAA